MSNLLRLKSSNKSLSSFIIGWVAGSYNNCGLLNRFNILFKSKILDTPASDFLIEQIAEHIRFALIHPANDTATVEDVIPVLTIDRIAQYVASKEQHRKKTH